MLNKYIFDDPMFEFRQVEKTFSSPIIETGFEPPTSYLVGTGCVCVFVCVGGKGGRKVTR